MISLYLSVVRIPQRTEHMPTPHGLLGSDEVLKAVFLAGEVGLMGGWLRNMVMS